MESIPSGDRGAGNLPAIPRLVFRRNDAALVPVRLTRDQRIEGWRQFIKISLEPHIKAKKDHAAIYVLAEQLAATDVGHLEMIDGLADRVAELERERA